MRPVYERIPAHPSMTQNRAAPPRRASRALTRARRAFESSRREASPPQAESAAQGTRGITHPPAPWAVALRTRQREVRRQNRKVEHVHVAITVAVAVDER